MTQQVARLIRDNSGLPPTGNRHVDFKRQVRRAMRCPEDRVSWVAARYQESLKEMRGKTLAHMISRYADVAAFVRNVETLGVQLDPFSKAVFREVWLILRFVRRYGHEARYTRVVNWKSR